MVDFNGEDAVWLQYPDRAGGFGHTSLLIQDDNEQWYYFFWGASSTANKFALLMGTTSYYCFECVGTGEINSLEDVINLVECSTYDEASTGLESYIYISGDFSDSFDYLNGLKTKKYRLLSRNCVQTCTKALSFGTFSEYNNESIYAMTRISMITTPKAAYRAWDYFSKNIDAYKKANWWNRWTTNNPYRYIPCY